MRWKSFSQLISGQDIFFSKKDFLRKTFNYILDSFYFPLLTKFKLHTLEYIISKNIIQPQNPFNLESIKYPDYKLLIF